MKFYTGPEDLKDVIERYIVIGNDMAVYYLNNRKVSITNFTEEQREEIKKIMLQQLQERNESVNLRPYTLQKSFDTAVLTTLVGSYIANRIEFDTMKAYLTIGTIFGTIYLTNRILKEKAIIKEVKKSNLFLDMYEELQTPEGKGAVEELNFDKIYSEELNVNTLDDFSYSEVKEVHKKLKKVK